MRRRVAAATAVLSLVLLAGVAQAMPAPESIPAPEGAQAYVLGPGDQVQIDIAEMEDQIPNKPVRVDPNGFIDLPLLGRMQASGLTLEQLKAAIAGKVSKYITNPNISLNLTDNQSRPVSVIGAVNNPGVHQVQGPERLIQIISLAGGLRADAGTSVVLTRQAKWGALPLPDAISDPGQGFSTAKIPLQGLLAADHPADNILIMPDDVISVPKADLIYVVGDVKKAGGFELSARNSMSVLQALSLSEGLGPSASPKTARIMRPVAKDSTKMQEIPIDIQKIFAGKSPDVALYANDVLFVPNSLAKSSAKRAMELVLQTASGVAIYAH